MTDNERKTKRAEAIEHGKALHSQLNYWVAARDEVDAREKAACEKIYQAHQELKTVRSEYREAPARISATWGALHMNERLVKSLRANPDRARDELETLKARIAILKNALDEMTEGLV